MCLEPSAGIGGLADWLPKDRTTCVEVSSLHCKILESKGHKWIEDDFLKMNILNKFDRVVMNPPFDRGQWQAHIEHAASMVSKGGRLVAILPSGAPTRTALKGFNLEWHGLYGNMFAGASVSVVILVATKL